MTSMTPVMRHALGEAARRVVAMPVLVLASLLVAAIVTLASVGPDEQGQLRSAGGYTWSLTLWYLPVGVIWAWFIRRRNQTIQRPAFWTTLVILLVVGFALDFFLAHSFFVFPEGSATLLPDAPALGGPVPLEEYLFYLGGFLFILLLYVWLDEDFLSRYNVPDYAATWRQSGRQRVAEFDGLSLAAAVLMIGLAWAYKASIPPDPYRGGFPAYFAYLAAAGLTPAVGLLKGTRQYINWRAFTVVFLTVVAVSILWEVTLAAPLGWWGYQPPRMLGIVVPAWHDLPLEAVLVWLAASFSTVIIYEFIKVWQASGGRTPAFVPPAARAGMRKVYYMS